MVEILPLLAAKLVQGVWADVSGLSAISRRLRWLASLMGDTVWSWLPTLLENSWPA